MWSVQRHAHCVVMPKVVTTEDPLSRDTFVPAVLVGIAALLASILAGAVLTPSRDVIGLENLTIVYVTVVAVAAVVGGGAGGLFAAIAAALSYTFFFTTPYMSMRVDTFEQVVTVVLLFASGTAVSVAANLARGRLADGWPTADALDEDAAQLVTAVVRAKAGGANAEQLAVEGLRHLFDARWVAIIPSNHSSGRTLVAAGDLPSFNRLDAPRSGVWNSALRWPPQPPAGAVAQVQVDQQHVDALVVLPRPQRPLTSEMMTIVLAVVRALEEH